jgi:signal transduction histidine kinase
MQNGDRTDSSDVRCFHSGDLGDIVLRIGDSKPGGLGMDEEVLSHIFERNFSTRPDGSGGLGLRSCATSCSRTRAPCA